MPALLKQNRTIRIGGQRGLCLALRGGESLPARLADAALADRGLFHLCTHGPEIVGGRDHREQDHQHASQGQQTLNGGEPARSRRAPAAAPQQVCGQRQQQPGEVEKQFHQLILETGDLKQSTALRPTETTQNIDVSFSERSNFSQCDLGAPAYWMQDRAVGSFPMESPLCEIK